MSLFTSQVLVRFNEKFQIVTGAVNSVTQKVLSQLPSPQFFSIWTVAYFLLLYCYDLNKVCLSVCFIARCSRNLFRNKDNVEMLRNGGTARLDSSIISCEVWRSKLQLVMARCEVWRSKLQLVMARCEVWRSKLQLVMARCEVWRNKLQLVMARCEVWRSKLQLVMARCEVWRSKLQLVMALSSYLSSCREKSTKALYVGQIQTRLGFVFISEFSV